MREERSAAGKDKGISGGACERSAHTHTHTRVAHRTKGSLLCIDCRRARERERGVGRTDTRRDNAVGGLCRARERGNGPRANTYYYPHFLRTSVFASTICIYDVHVKQRGVPCFLLFLLIFRPCFRTSLARTTKLMFFTCFFDLSYRQGHPGVRWHDYDLVRNWHGHLYYI